jgi:hypothetical protein
MTSQDLSIEAIQFKLGHTAAWRTAMAEKFPDDKRNRRAAETLTELSQADGREISAETWTALAPHLESPALRDSVSEAARDCGFRSRPKTLDEFVQNIVRKLGAASHH